MKALFLGTLAASQATPIIKFITADIRTEILDTNEPAQAAAALTDADVVLTGVWRSGFPAAPKLRLLQVPLAGTDGIDVSLLPRGVTLCNAYGHEPALGEFAIMMMLAWRHRLFEITTSFREGSWSWSPMVGGAVRGEIGAQTVSRVARGRARLPGACCQPNDAREADLGRACVLLDGTQPHARRMGRPWRRCAPRMACRRPMCWTTPPAGPTATGFGSWWALCARRAFC